MEPFPVLELEGVLVVKVHTEVDDQRIEALRHDLLARIEGRATRGVLLDLSDLTVMDAYTAGVFETLARSTALAGAPLVLIGIRPEVALTLVELGVHFHGIATARTLERGLELLRK